ncbi:MAG: hypothetical protein RBR68_13610 [Tenuifilaceae bacterium]|nr:hypothetical protein [Tenuifilaceae bacterium]
MSNKDKIKQIKRIAREICPFQDIPRVKRFPKNSKKYKLKKLLDKEAKEMLNEKDA